MAFSDAEIARINIRQMWNTRIGPGGPWGQTVNINGKDIDLGAWYEFVVAEDSEHGLENCYIDMMAWRGGDANLRKSQSVINALALQVPYIQGVVDTINGWYETGPGVPVAGSQTRPNSWINYLLGKVQQIAKANNLTDSSPTS